MNTDYCHQQLHISDFSIKKNILFMNILNSSEPNIDP